MVGEGDGKVEKSGLRKPIQLGEISDDRIDRVGWRVSVGIMLDSKKTGPVEDLSIGHKRLRLRPNKSVLEPAREGDRAIWELNTRLILDREGSQNRDLIVPNVHMKLVMLEPREGDGQLIVSSNYLNVSTGNNPSEPKVVRFTEFAGSIDEVFSQMIANRLGCKVIRRIGAADERVVKNARDRGYVQSELIVGSAIPELEKVYYPKAD